MNSKDYYDYISESVDIFASRADDLIYGEFIQEYFENILALACLWTSFYQCPFPIDLNSIEIYKKKPKKGKGKKKARGQFFTPPYIAEYIVENTIGPMIKKIKKDKRIKYKKKKILELKICDPAMGGGIFLVKAHDFIFEHLIAMEPKLTSKIVEDLSRQSSKCIFGVDIDKKAVELSKTSLQLNIMKHSLICKIEEYANGVA